MKTLAHISLKSNDRKAIEAAKDLLVQKYPVELIILYGRKPRQEGHDAVHLREQGL